MDTCTDRNLRYKPIIKWAGGKNWLIDRLKKIIPENFNRYHEPFFGGGSTFFNLKPSAGACLSDTNEELINFFIQLQNDFESVLSILSTNEISEEYFYRLRETILVDDVERAARFYYLNQTCFNGLYRVNQQGKFNVPYGRNNITNLSDHDKFLKIHEMLQTSIIRCCDFGETLSEINKNDLVFLDPPYTVAHNLNGFIEYNKKLFSWSDQERLAKYIANIIEKGAFFILTNANHSSTVELYKHLGKVSEVTRFSTIGGKAQSRKKISEIIVTNCPELI
ncbi:hypothetical protein A0256_19600 [Mucilaginibacter sp. PAMC 26640]|nr:hypothetical protein A0256_19600 [Mucilaginibacter sp. PAMC 26640]